MVFDPNVMKLLDRTAPGARSGNIFQLVGDGSVRPGPSDLGALATEAARVVPNAGLVLIGPATRPGWVAVNENGIVTGAGLGGGPHVKVFPASYAAPKGIIAILIGLLLPAVQKVRESANRTPSGHAAWGGVNVLLGDGSVRMALTPFTAKGLNSSIFVANA